MKHSQLKNIGWFLIATIIIGSLLVIADLNEIIESLREANPTILAFGLALGVLNIYFWAYVWQKIFSLSNIKIPFKRTFHLYTGALFMNSITPLGRAGGEPIIAYLITEKLPTDYEKTLSTLLYADSINLFPLITFGIIGSITLFFLGFLSPETNTLFTIIFGIAIIIAIISFSKRRKKQLSNYLHHYYKGKDSKILEKLLTEIRETIQDLKEIYTAIKEKPSSLGPPVIVSHLAYFSQVLVLYLTLLSLGVSVNIGYLLLILPLSIVGHISPTPGASGTAEAVLAGLLATVAGVQFSVAVTAAILFRLCTFWPGLIIGYMGFTTLGQTHSMEKVHEAVE